MKKSVLDLYKERIQEHLKDVLENEVALCQERIVDYFLSGKTPKEVAMVYMKDREHV